MQKPKGIWIASSLIPTKYAILVKSKWILEVGKDLKSTGQKIAGEGYMIMSQEQKMLGIIQSFFVVSLVMAHHVLLNQPQVNSLYAHDPTIAKVMLR